MTIETKIVTRLKTWQTPNFATVDLPPGRKEDGPKPLPTIAIADLGAEALDALAQAWLNELYTKATRINPFHCTSER